MLAGFLTVLKIIGIVLLVILAIVLILLLLVLFVPIRYKADVLVPETKLDNGFDVEKIELSAGFSWLLHFITGKIEFPENKQFVLRILGIKIFPRDKKKEDSSKADGALEGESDSGEKKKKKKDKNKGKNADKDCDSESTAESSETGYIEMSDMDGASGDSAKEDISDNESESQTEENVTNSADNSENNKEDKALIEILTDFFEKVQNILKTPQNVLEKIQYTISRVCDKIKMIKTTLESDIFKRAFDLVKKKLLRIIKMILPDKIKAAILFGSGDPADTAEIMALYGTLYPVLFDKVSFEPDFDRKVVMADAHIKGHITVFTILYSVLVCYFNKDVKKVIKRIKKIIET